MINEVRLDDAERSIELQRGEALFTVAHDAQRPFRVRTRTALVEAIGTQFNVYERPDGTRISVLDGRVRIRAARGTQTLGVGEEAHARLDGESLAELLSREPDLTIERRDGEIVIRGN